MQWRIEMKEKLINNIGETKKAKKIKKIMAA
jgi:hypothetical protein